MKTQGNKADQVRTRKDALRALTNRQRQALKLGKIDNSMLYAGSPMFFYCTLCGLQSDTKPEAYVDVPKTLCVGCKPDVDAGLLNQGNDRMTEEVPLRSMERGSKEFLSVGEIED